MKSRTEDSPIDLSSLLSLASSCARRVGDELKRRKPEHAVLNRAARHDLKIKADVFADKEIVNPLQSTGISVFSEESGLLSATGASGMDSSLCWIVDPLDGSLNYFHEIPFCCISIALFREWEPLLGVVYDFNREDLYGGIAGEGVWLNETPIETSQTADSASAVMLTGFPANRDFSDDSLLKFVHQLQHFRKVRLLGSAALSLAWVADGRADAYYEEDIMLWDVAAGCALVRAGGGDVILKHCGDREQPVTLIAHNGRLALPFDLDSHSK